MEKETFAIGRNANVANLMLVLIVHKNAVIVCVTISHNGGAVFANDKGKDDDDDDSDDDDDDDGNVAGHDHDDYNDEDEDDDNDEDDANHDGI